MIATHSVARLWTWRGLPLGHLALGLVAATVGAATYAIGSGIAAGGTNSVQPASTTTTAPPTAAEFAEEFMGVSNAYAQAHGDRARLANADCVQGSPGSYMCSYAVEKPSGASECHIMQARWTPEALSSFTVILSGRVPRCGSLHEALRSLK